MAYIMVVNQSAWPIHGALSWANVQQQCFNSLAKNQSYDFVVHLGWHDLTIVAGSESNKFQSSNNNNPADIGKFILNAAALAGPAGALTLAAMQMSGGQYVLDITSGRGGQSKVAKIVSKQVHLMPVQVRELYAPDGYTVTVTGGQVEGTYDEPTQTFTVTNLKPLALHWKNRNTLKSGDIIGQVV